MPIVAEIRHGLRDDTGASNNTMTQKTNMFIQPYYSPKQTFSRCDLFATNKVEFFKPNERATAANMDSASVSDPSYYNPQPAAGSELVYKIIEALGTHNAKGDMGLYSPASSLSSRGVKVMVKDKRNVNRPASELSDAVSNTADSAASSSALSATDTQAPPTKRVKLVLKGPRRLSPSTTRSGAAIKILNPASHIEAVIAGTSLPRDGVEAIKASNERHDRLLAKVKASRAAQSASPSRSRRTRRVMLPDLMPEFFNFRDHAAGAVDDSEVRCVCGVTQDDGEKMICCENCEVWQHAKCMGAGVPKNMEGGRYKCHMCDLWSHRVIIAKLRKANPLD